MSHLVKRGLLPLLGSLLGVGEGVGIAGVEQRRCAGPVQRLEGELGGQQLADGPQGGAGVGRQRGVSQQVGDQAVGLSHHGDVHHDGGARRLQGATERDKSQWLSEFLSRAPCDASERQQGVKSSCFLFFIFGAQSCFFMLETQPDFAQNLILFFFSACVCMCLCVCGCLHHVKHQNQP